MDQRRDAAVGLGADPDPVQRGRPVPDDGGQLAPRQPLTRKVVSERWRGSPVSP
ncbi:hypothetical protein ACIBL8_24060 [Streptomyces sp. NPDC050523]|uniref:hypothetical protein n=1 Tax=Streptomyces sp. NPDC050523 TaxID=3365622 RepID=UPI0037B7B415